MKWKDFQIEKEGYKKTWEQLKNCYTGNMRQYLDQSKIMVSAGREFEIDDDFSKAVGSCPAFFINLRCGELEELEIIDNWRVIIKFPYVDIDLIEELKRSPFCDRDRTIMRPTSTDVVIIRS